MEVNEKIFSLTELLLLSLPANQATREMLSIAKIAIACLHTIPQSGQNNVANFLRTFNSEATFGKYSTNNHIRRIS